MKTHTTIFCLPKAENQPSEYQDAYFQQSDSEDGDCESLEQRFAVADGATESIFSGPWAKLLTDEWGSGGLDLVGDYENTIARLSLRWRTAITSEALPWWAEEKIDKGAFSTFAGLQLCRKPDGSASWSLTAIGDSCLFLIRGNKLKFSGPLESAEQFNSCPYLIGSSIECNSEFKNHLKVYTGVLRKYDHLILATDAVACWFISKIKGGIKPSDLLEFEDYEDYKDQRSAFVDFVKKARSSAVMRNDDVTLVSIIVRAV